jgi:tetratricopeptide (TPR) repeat protein
LDEQIGKAYNHLRQAIGLAEDIQHSWGAALAKRALGSIAHTSGNLAEAETHLQEALEQLDAIQSRFDQAHTHLDLAALAYSRGDQNATKTHLNQAYDWFKKLQVPKYIERTEKLAREYGMTLTEIDLEELSEGDV